MWFTRFQSAFVVTILSFIFVAGLYAISSVNPQPGQSDWAVTSNTGVVLDEVTPYQPTALSDSDAVGSVVTLSSPGIYRLSAPMTKRIVISASNVDLDLNEYGLSMSGSATAIKVSGVSNVVIRNGYVDGPGMVDRNRGIMVDGSSVATSKVFIRNIRVSGFFYGIYMFGTGGTLEQCEVISCTTDSTQYGFTLIACDYSLLSHCSAASSNFAGFEIASTGDRIENCTAVGSGSYGFNLDMSFSVCSRCSVTSTLAGPTFNIEGTGNVFENCFASNSFDVGFYFKSNNSLMENCMATLNVKGFSNSSVSPNSRLLQNCLATENSQGFEGSGFAYQNRDITGGVFTWDSNVAASP